MAYKKKLVKPEHKFHVKRGDTVKVISGDSKGKTGTIIKVDRDKSRAVVEGLNMIKKHVKPTAQDPQSGGIVEMEAPIHISNLMVVEMVKEGKESVAKTTRTGRKVNEAGKLQRYSKKTGNFISDGQA